MALEPPLAAAVRRAVQIVRQEPERRHVLTLAEKLHRELSEQGHWVGASRCQIAPLIVGEARRASALSRRLQEQGLLVPAIRPPSVPQGSARLRISVTADHTEADVAQLANALRNLVPSRA